MRQRRSFPGSLTISAWPPFSFCVIITRREGRVNRKNLTRREVDYFWGTSRFKRKELPANRRLWSAGKIQYVFPVSTAVLRLAKNVKRSRISTLGLCFFIPRGSDSILQSRIHRFAFKGKYAEYAFVHPIEWFLVHEAGKRFHPKCELPHR